MTDPNEPKLLDHDADGIKELDNNLPRWWVWMFYLSIAFAVVYIHYFHLFDLGDLQAEEYAKQMEKGNAIKEAALADFESNMESLEPSTNPTELALGKKTFTSYCLPCHRADGGGLAGPNLCDDYWIHGDAYSDSVKVILNGVPEKGMLTWRDMLKPREILAVASYIYTFRGTNPPNPKPPENQQAPEEPNPYE